jgi:hypothetical protein
VGPRAREREEWAAISAVICVAPEYGNRRECFETVPDYSRQRERATVDFEAENVSVKFLWVYAKARRVVVKGLAVGLVIVSIVAGVAWWFGSRTRALPSPPTVPRPGDFG